MHPTIFRKLIPVLPECFMAFGLTLAVSVALAEPLPLYKDASQPQEARVEDLLSRLTLEEKMSLIHADSKFATPAIPRLGIPRRWLSDGPHGVREEVSTNSWASANRKDDFCTYLPVSIALAATWNPELGFAYGRVIGEEARYRGKDIMLGPGLNIQRTPLCGRNFEYLGEDPCLTAQMGVGYIRGEQSQGVAACAKHFALNNQEISRGSINVEVDERALRELYLPAFRAAVQQAGVLAVMGALNQFRGQHCCESDYLLNKILKGEWGFQGLVVSDWNGAHHTREAALNGLDLEMGTDYRTYDNYFLARSFQDGLQKGEYPQSILDEKVRRNLRVMFASRVMDTRPSGSFNSPEHQATARRVAEEAIVLLKNQGDLLPLNPAAIKSVAVIGENATVLQAHAGGSSRLKAFYEVTPLEGLRKRLGSQVKITCAKGYDSNNSDGLIAEAVSAAQQADAAIIVGGLSHQLDKEGSDRKDLKLPGSQAELIQRVVQANPKTIVVLVSGSPVEMDPWLGQVPAVLEAWYDGMEAGNAIAEVLCGDVCPSGKLPCSFPKRLEDSPAHALRAYPGKNGVVNYAEGLLVGYRWFDTKGIEPLFPFGHGLSYTQFEYSGLKVRSVHSTNGQLAVVQVDVANTGNREGAEVVQVYVHQNQPSLPRPDKELKAFRKVNLKPGEKQTVALPMGQSAFAYYDPAKSSWVAEKGDYRVLVGSSSRDIRQQQTFSLAETVTQK